MYNFVAEFFLRKQYELPISPVNRSTSYCDCAKLLYVISSLRRVIPLCLQILVLFVGCFLFTQPITISCSRSEYIKIQAQSTFSMHS